MEHHHNLSLKSRMIGGALLIAGCCIGAGMLGVPVITAQAGFFPSVVMFVFCWIFMTMTGLLLLEAHLWFGSERLSMISLTEKTLGSFSKSLTWISFLFLFYSLMVAYVIGSGSLFADLLSQAFHIQIPTYKGSLGFILLFGSLVYLGTSAVDYFNRILMFGLIIAYFALVFLGLPHVEWVELQQRDWGAALYVMPVMIISFGFHNMVPSLTHYLHGHTKLLKKAVIIGSVIPLFVYLIWELVLLGIVPLDGEHGFRQALSNGDLATHALMAVANYAWISLISQAFAFFALVTSFLTVALSFVDFLSDGLKIEKKGLRHAFLCFLAFGPPFLFALYYPQIFLSALTYAGGFAAVLLFGILPAFMVWKGRYVKNMRGPQLVPFGKPMLVLIILIALGIMFLEILKEIPSYAS